MLGVTQKKDSVWKQSSNIIYKQAFYLAPLGSYKTKNDCVYMLHNSNKDHNKEQYITK